MVNAAAPDQHRTSTGPAPGGEPLSGGQQASRAELRHHTHIVAVVHGRSSLHRRPHTVSRVQLQDLLGEDLMTACGQEERKRRSVWLRKGKIISCAVMRLANQVAFLHFLAHPADRTFQAQTNCIRAHGSASWALESSRHANKDGVQPLDCTLRRSLCNSQS